MCDLISWGLVRNPLIKRKLGLRSPLIFLTDAEMQTMIDAPSGTYGNRSWSWDDVCGHAALAAYYHLSIDDFEHFESDRCIPRRIAAAVRNGEFRNAFASQDKILRFTTKGLRIFSNPYMAPFKSSPEFTLLISLFKSLYPIVMKYYPLLETEPGDGPFNKLPIDSPSLSLPSCIKTLRKAYRNHDCNPNYIKEERSNIFNSIMIWSVTPQCHYFWFLISFMMRPEDSRLVLRKPLSDLVIAESNPIVSAYLGSL